MLNKFSKLYEKYFYLIIIFLFITITYFGVVPAESIVGNNNFFKNIVQINSKLFEMVRDYKYIIYILIFIISSIYIFINGNKRNKIITGIVIFTSLLTFLNSILSKQTYFLNLEIKHIIVLALFFVFLNIFEIFIKEKGKNHLENLLFKTIKIIVIYIGLVFLLGKVTNTYCITYSYFPYGYSGRFLERNALSNVFVIIIPILMYFFHTKKEYKTLIYIIIAITCSLLIGTKSAYFAVYASLIVFLLVSIIEFIKYKKTNIIKAIIISAGLIFLILINTHLYGYQFIKRDITVYSVKEQTAVKNNIEYKEDVITNIILDDRTKTLNQMWAIYKRQNLYTKIVGIGFYYPKYYYTMVEMDFFDILFKQGIIGLSLYLYVTFYYIILIIKNIKNNYKELNLIKLILPLASVSTATVSSIIAGHVIYNYITIFFYAFAITFLYNKTISR